MRLSSEELHRLICDKLQKHGCDSPNASAAADFMVAACIDGCISHGIFRLPGYVASLRSGKVNGRARPRLKTLGPSVLQCDGDGGFAPLALWRSLDELAGLAKTQGVAALSLIRAYHFSALWIEVEHLSEQGLVAFAYTAAKAMVAPAGGVRAFFGTNPMAFAWPRAGKPALVFDQASALLARGDIMLAAEAGHAVPEGAGIDSEGRATRSAKAILAGGAQLAFGGYKGSNLALMVELLAAALVGDYCSFEAELHDNKDGGPSRGGEFILALDPGQFGGGDYDAHAEALFAEMLTQDGVRLPSSRRYENRERARKEGIEVADALYDKVMQL